MIPERGRVKTGGLLARHVTEITPASALANPDWMLVRFSDGPRLREVKRVQRQKRLQAVCEEASCSDITECFGSDTVVAHLVIVKDIKRVELKAS